MPSLLTDMSSESAYIDYDRSLDRLVMISEPIHDQIRAAFKAGYEAGQLSPIALKENTDATDLRRPSPRSHIYDDIDTERERQTVGRHHGLEYLVGLSHLYAYNDGETTRRALIKALAILTVAVELVEADTYATDHLIG